MEDYGGAARLPLLLGLALSLAIWVGIGLSPASTRPEAARAAVGDLFQFGFPTVAAVVAGALAVLCALLAAALRRQRITARRLRETEIELAEQRERLRRYVADLERIADVASHDLQEPLRRVVSYSQLLAQHDAAGRDEELRGYVGHVVEGARRMKALVTGLHDFVAVDSLPATGETCSAAAALAAARTRLSDQMALAGVTLVVDSLPEVVADRASLVEVFAQLLDNAIRYAASARPPVVRVAARMEGDQVRFAVSDNGPGIEPVRAARMFEIFYRPRVADGAAPAGIGMGLAVVRRLVERLGGSVWVESTPGEGSSFGFSLRAAAGEGKRAA